MQFTKMRALSVRQPWIHNILFDGKDVENRDWPTKIRGDVLLHASRTVDREDRAEVAAKNMPLGGIVGVVEIVDCVEKSDSDWFVGQYGFVLRNPRSIDLIPCKGALGFFWPDLEPSDAHRLGSLIDAMDAAA